MGGEDAEGAQSREREREKEKNNESSERQECFSGNVFQENEEGNISFRKKGDLEARMDLKMSELQKRLRKHWEAISTSQP